MTRKALIVSMAMLLMLHPFSAASAATPKPGASCSKLGSTQASKGLTYTCVKSGKKTVWNKGVAASKKIQPQPTVEPTPSASASADPTPSDPIAIRINKLINPGSGTTGVYLKEVNGAKLADFQSSFVFDPSSSIKAVIALYAFNRKAAGALQLTDQVPKVVASGGCPTPQTSGTESIETAIKFMLQNSDNDRTLELMMHFGVTQLNDFARSIGLTDTAFKTTTEAPGFVIVGCGIKPVPARPTTRSGNTTTLVDLTKVWELIDALPASDREKFMTLTVGREMAEAQRATSGLWPQLQQIAKEEAPATLSATAFEKFKAGLRINAKGGSGVLCIPAAGCAKYKIWMSYIGLTTIPVCQANGSASTKRYVWGYFMHGANSDVQNIDDTNPTSKGMIATGAEPMREQLRSALANWASCSA